MCWKFCKTIFSRNFTGFEIWYPGVGIRTIRLRAPVEKDDCGRASSLLFGETYRGKIDSPELINSRLAMRNGLDYNIIIIYVCLSLAVNDVNDTKLTKFGGTRYQGPIRLVGPLS